MDSSEGGRRPIDGRQRVNKCEKEGRGSEGRNEQHRTIERREEAE